MAIKAEFKDRIWNSFVRSWIHFTVNMTMPVSLKRVYYMYLLHIINDISMYNDIKRKIVISSGWTVYNVITMAVSSRTQRKLRLSFDRCQGNLLTLCAKSRNFEKIEFKSMNLCTLFLSVCYWFVIGFRGGVYGKCEL